MRTEPTAAPPPTPEQQAVIDDQEGTLVVLAAVGSGKTTTLGRRIARALAAGLRPERVLALTFTNRAAHHMRESLARVVAPEVARQVTLSTFHGLCAQILRTAPAEAGLPADFRIVDEDDAQELLADHFPEGGPRQAFFRLAEAASAAPLGSCRVDTWHSGALLAEPWAPAYAQALQDRGAVDFSGLVYLTRAVLGAPGEAQDLWRTRFDMVQVDEVQDTHLSEYEVLRVLASRSTSLCLVGDLDQTIYSWRGSAPQALLARLDADFPPVRTRALTRCFRATKRVLAVADALATGLDDRSSTVVAAAGRPEGERPVLRSYETAELERQGVATTAAGLLRAGVAPERIAVLVRTNKAIAQLSATFTSRGLPCTTVEQFKFFRRQEVKDTLALARLVVDRRDELAARRVAGRLVVGVGAKTVQRIVQQGRACGLRLSDLTDPATVAHGDPLWALAGQDVVVLDTETTGFDPLEDEIIELGAVRLRGGRWSGDPADTFSALLRNTRPVGASEAVHHISDARLRQQGQPPATVLADFAAFLGDLPIAGHNVAFDRKMIEGHSARLGQPLRLRVLVDTLDAARRLLPAGPHKLGALLARLGITGVENSHRALDDVKATVALLHALADRAQAGAPDRQALVAREAGAFGRLRTALDRWAGLGQRPHALIQTIAKEAMGPKLRRDPQRIARMARLSELVGRIRAMDRPALAPDLALAAVLEQLALSRDVDALEDKPGVRILTMHQSKGLEFDHVIVPGLHEGGLPSWWVARAEDEDALQEELRLLYVAVTRARQGLHLSWAAKGDRGHSQRPSRFLAAVPERLLPRRSGPPAP